MTAHDPTLLPHDPTLLPPDLPAPVDDGAADHLRGAALPAVVLPSTGGSPVDLAALAAGRLLVLFAYPRTGRPGEEALPGWDDIPGARGCTPQACSFRDLAADFAARGADVVGVSTQSPEDQHEAVERLHLPYPLLSDAHLRLATALRLPTFEVEDHVLLRRLTLVARDGVVVAVQYPVFPPDRSAADAVALLDRLG